MSRKSNKKKSSKVSRRNFMAAASSAVAAGAVVNPLGGSTSSARAASPNKGGSNVSPSRETEAAQIRLDGAQRHLEFTQSLPTQHDSGDTQRYDQDNYYANFTKTLPHDALGEVDPVAFEALLHATSTGKSSDFDAIPLDATADRLLANPQGAFRYVFAGLDGHATRMRPAPAFRSAEAAAEMAEVYWLAMTRDIPFTAYNFNRMINSACSDLNAFSETVGPTVNGAVTPQTLFRGSTVGDLTGPYISQFLWKNVPYGPSTIVQKYPKPVVNDDFMTSYDEWLHVQRGGAPNFTQSFDASDRYIFNNRTLGEYVYGDVLFQAYFNAMLISFQYGAVAVGNPYGSSISNQGPFTSLGGPWYIDLLTQAGNLSLAGAWCQKWIHHLRCRPEVFAGRIHNHIEGNATYELHSDILNSRVLNQLYRRNGNYLLPMAYPEGSPTHPSYPAGHATVAGACATVLKAVFDEDFVIPDPVVSRNGTILEPYNGDPLTLGGEFNKLANNVALGRDAAGVHYRTDGTEGILVGEQQAIALLQDYSTALNEDFGGFHFTSFEGNQISIVDGDVVS